MGILLGLAGAIGFFACIGLLIFSVIKKKPLKSAALGLLASVVVFFVGVAVTPTSAAPDDSNNEETSEKMENRSTPPKLHKDVKSQDAELDSVPVAEPDAEVYDSEPIPQITNAEMEALFVASKANKVKPENLTVQVYPATGRCNVNYITRDTFWDETDFIRSQISAYINFCLDAYEVDGITDVFFMVSTEMTDPKGNKEDEVVMKIDMEKEAFAIYNWENMEYRSGMFEQFEADCSVLDIHAGILNNANTEKIYYVP